MQCLQVQDMVDDYLDGMLAPIQVNIISEHLTSCQDCKNYFDQADSLMLYLKDMPAPPPRDGYENRVLRFLEEKDVAASTKQHYWFAAGFGSAIAASLAFWLVFSPVSTLTPSAKWLSTVQLDVHKKRTIDLVFNLQYEVSSATLTLELPEKVEIAGYPGKRTLQWDTAFKKGANRLALPLIAKGENKGILIARLAHKGKEKTFYVQIDAEQKSKYLFLRGDAQITS